MLSGGDISHYLNYALYTVFIYVKLGIACHYCTASLLNNLWNLADFIHVPTQVAFRNVMLYIKGTRSGSNAVCLAALVCHFCPEGRKFY